MKKEHLNKENFDTPSQQANAGVKKRVAKKMGIKKTMIRHEMENNRKNPKHGFRHELYQGSSKKYLDHMEENAEKKSWEYARENRMSDKRIF